MYKLLGSPELVQYLATLDVRIDISSWKIFWDMNT